MNKIYDKLLLAIAALLFAGGVYLYLQKSGAAPSADTVARSAADNPYEPIPIAESESVEATWPEVGPQPAGPRWIYDVFTPPKIYLDLATGEFTAEPPVPPQPPVPFGIYLSGVEREAYRLQLEGYIEEDRSDSSKTLLLMYDEEAEKQVRARPGDEKPEAEFELLNFDIERIRDGNNNIEVVATAVILDQRTGEEVTLVHGERRFESGVTAIIRSEQDPSYVKELEEAPVEFEGPLGNYTLLEINLEESSVKVEKHGVEERDPEVETLRVRRSMPTTPPPAETITPTNEPNEENEEDINFFFE